MLSAALRNRARAMVHLSVIVCARPVGLVDRTRVCLWLIQPLSQSLPKTAFGRKWRVNPNVADPLRGKTRQSAPDVDARRLGQDEQYLTVREILSEVSTVADGALSRERSDFYRFAFATLGLRLRGKVGKSDELTGC